MLTRFSLLVAMFLALSVAALLVAGCGGSSAKNSTPTVNQVTSTAPPTPVPSQAGGPTSTQEPSVVLNDVNNQLNSIDNELNQTDSGPDSWVPSSRMTKQQGRENRSWERTNQHCPPSR